MLTLANGCLPVAVLRETAGQPSYDQLFESQLDTGRYM